MRDGLIRAPRATEAAARARCKDTAKSATFVSSVRIRLWHRRPDSFFFSCCVVCMSVLWENICTVSRYTPLYVARKSPPPPWFSITEEEKIDYKKIWKHLFWITPPPWWCGWTGIWRSILSMINFPPPLQVIRNSSLECSLLDNTSN